MIETPLFCFDMANNHFGDSQHAKTIIRELYHVKKHFPYSVAIKFQFRDLDTFIHKDYQGDFSYKYVKRFTTTRLSWDDFGWLKDEAKSLGFITECTPFDEFSVDQMEKMGFDILKIASCSFTDWPLLERVASTKFPIIASTAGAKLEDIDRVVSFLLHRDKELVLMHCVANYPTDVEDLQLNQLDLFKSRYPGVTIGLSLHTGADDLTSVKIAIGKGIRVFERHIGCNVPMKGYLNNTYSITPTDTMEWLKEAERAFNVCGYQDTRTQYSGEELEELRSLQRGVWAKADLKAGSKIDRSDLQLAIPAKTGQLTANDLSKYVSLYPIVDIPKGYPIFASAVSAIDSREKITEITNRVKDLIRKSGVFVPSRLELEISHHYGINKFDEYGCVLINFINKAYCKKLIIVMPGQKHPAQFHKIKEETFTLLYGDLSMELDGMEMEILPGETVDIMPGAVHVFSSKKGAVIEEISSTHFKDDSYYVDKTINENPFRKTEVTHWMG